jgi:hypothetical protein
LQGAAQQCLWLASVRETAPCRAKRGYAFAFPVRPRRAQARAGAWKGLIDTERLRRTEAGRPDVAILCPGERGRGGCWRQQQDQRKNGVTNDATRAHIFPLSLACMGGAPSRDLPAANLHGGSDVRINVPLGVRDAPLWPKVDRIPLTEVGAWVGEQSWSLGRAQRVAAYQGRRVLRSSIRGAVPLAAMAPQSVGCGLRGGGDCR